MRKKKIAKRNTGVCHERTKRYYGDGLPNWEAIFQREWDKENTDVNFINTGLGIAQTLFCVSEESAKEFDGPNRDDIPYMDFGLHKGVCVYKLSMREQRIIATIIQWLGTNCGFSFLRKCIEECGYELKPKFSTIVDRKDDRIPKRKILWNQNIVSVDRDDSSFILPDVQEIDRALNGFQSVLFSEENKK